MQAPFAPSVVGPLRDLGLAEASQVTLLKLLAALPERQRREAEHIQPRVYIMEPFGFVFAALAALAAGFVNALAGGGTLISFPVLTAIGIPPVAANMTNAVALSPGYFGGTWAQWPDLRDQRRRLALFAGVGVLGGVLGAVLLALSSDRVFSFLVPFLILGASILMALQDRLRAWIKARAERLGRPSGGDWQAAPFIGLASVYGGYFGAGLGVILIATLGLVLDDTLTRLNALKQAISFAANLAATVFFIFSGKVVWPIAAVMAVAALAGGALGGHLAGRVKPEVLRGIVVGFGLVVSAVYFVRLWQG